MLEPVRNVRPLLVNSIRVHCRRHSPRRTMPCQESAPLLDVDSGRGGFQRVCKNQSHWEIHHDIMVLWCSDMLPWRGEVWTKPAACLDPEERDKKEKAEWLKPFATKDAKTTLLCCNHLSQQSA